jgi:DNA-binding PadR family transcriptional regulator
LYGIIDTIEERVWAMVQGTADELPVSGYVVLGLIARYGPMTPYDLKAAVARSMDFFWPIPHAQLYRYPAKLAERGLLTEQTEEFGRRRRVFQLTDAGRAELSRWLTYAPIADLETRDPAAVKLALSDLIDPDPSAALAREQAERHRNWLTHYHQRRAGLDPDAADSRSRSRMLEFGIAISRAYLDFWQSLAENPSGPEHTDSDTR